MQGPNMLEVPPIKTWADITDQKVGTNAINNAPAASVRIPAAIKARLDRRRSTSAPAGVWERVRRVLRPTYSQPGKSRERVRLPSERPREKNSASPRPA